MAVLCGREGSYLAESRFEWRMLGQFIAQNCCGLLVHGVLYGDVRVAFAYLCGTGIGAFNLRQVFLGNDALAGGLDLRGNFFGQVDLGRVVLVGWLLRLRFGGTYRTSGGSWSSGSN